MVLNPRRSFGYYVDAAEATHDAVELSTVISSQRTSESAGIALERPNVVHITVEHKTMIEGP